MLLNYIFNNFIKSNSKLLLSYTIINLIIYQIEVLGLSRLYSKLINKSKNIKKINIPPIENIFNKKSYNNPTVEILIIYIFIILMILVFIERIRDYMFSFIDPKFQMWMRNTIFKKTIDKHNNNFREIKIGKEIVRLEDILFTVKEVFLYLITGGISLFVITIVILFYLYNSSFELGMIFLIYSIIFVLNLFFMYKKIKIKVFNRIDDFFKVSDNLDNTLSNLSNIYTNNRNNYEKKKNELY